MAVLNQAGHLEYGNLALDKPYVYFVTIITASFCTGIWGMFVFIDIAKRNQLLTGHQGRDSPIVKHWSSIKHSCFVTCVNSALCS
jgi:hypothetical protein